MPRVEFNVPKKRVNLRLPVVLLSALEAVAKAEGFSDRQTFIEQAIREKLDRWKSAGHRLPEGPSPADVAEEVRSGRRRVP